MCKAMCGVAAGACGGAINLYWAKGSDISDINAKFGAQVGSCGIFMLLLKTGFLLVSLEFFVHKTPTHTLSRIIR